MDQHKLKLITASAYAAFITIIFVVVITVFAELSAPLKDWLKNFSGHHWTTKSIFSVAVYAVATVVCYAVLRGGEGGGARRSLVLLLWGTALGTIILALFFTGHHFGVF